MNSTFRHPVLHAAPLFLAAILACCTTAPRNDPAPAAGTLRPAAAVTSAEVNGSRLELGLGPDRLTLEVVAPGILRAHFKPGGRTSPPTAVLAETTWHPPRAEISIETDPLVIATDSLRVEIRRNPFAVRVLGPSGKELLSGGVFGEGDLRFFHSDGDDFYGIHGFPAVGRSPEGVLRNSGGTVSAGVQGNAGGPLVWSTAGYGLLVDSSGGSFGITGTGLSFTGGSRKDTECYILTGTPEKIQEAVSRVSGKTPMFPRWAMGFMNSEWGIDQEELERTVATYRSLQLPIDCYILDFDWKAWGADGYGEWRWNTRNFPGGPSGTLKREMEKAGIRLAGIMKPRIHTATEQGRYAAKNGFWFAGRSAYRDYFSSREVNDLDFSSPECRAWFFDHAREAFDTGIVGWWNDEADGFDNFGFMNMQRALYEGQRAYSDRRVFSLNRNFYLGSQRYAYGLWSGDIGTGFPSMARQRERMLSAINLGETKWSMDTGGFTGTPGSENYARWMQFAAFVPLFRVHGSFGRQRQPWVYGKTALEAARAALELRYRLIPYIYSYERSAWETGTGIVKPLYFAFPHDPNTAGCVDSWLFGDYLLVSPVVEAGSTSKEVYLPEGRWIEYFSGAVHDGGRTVTCPLDARTWKDIPLFIRAGAIIPSQDFMNWTGERPVRTVYLDVFPDTRRTTFRLYDDDGETYGYEQGAYFSQVMSTESSGQAAVFEIGEKQGTWTGALEEYLVRIHTGISGEVTLNGKTLARFRDPADPGNAQGEGWSEGRDVYGPVVYVKVRAGEARKIEIR